MRERIGLVFVETNLMTSVWELFGTLPLFRTSVTNAELAIEANSIEIITVGRLRSSLLISKQIFYREDNLFRLGASLLAQLEITQVRERDSSPIRELLRPWLRKSHYPKVVLLFGSSSLPCEHDRHFVAIDLLPLR